MIETYEDLSSLSRISGHWLKIVILEGARPDVGKASDEYDLHSVGHIWNERRRHC